MHGILKFLRTTEPITGFPSVTGFSGDKNLLAIAQLAALRTNTSRALISLIDESHQYIIAEATRSPSLPQGAFAAKDSLFDHTRLTKRRSR